MTPTPNHTNAPTIAVTMAYSQSGQVKLQNRKSRVTSSVFWTMKMTSSPAPMSETIAPPLSRACPSPAPLVLESELV